MQENDPHIFVPVILTFDLLTSSLLSQLRLSRLQGDISTKFEVPKAFRSRVNRRHGTDGQTDGLGATLSAASYRTGGLHNNDGAHASSVSRHQ